MFDVIIEKGVILDGIGSSRYIADIGISGDKIEAIGDLAAAYCARRIDASKKFVCPGFIDSHCHTDTHAQYYPDAENKILQGVATDICGLCGTSSAPVADKHIDEFRQRNQGAILEEEHGGIEPISFAEYLGKINGQGNKTNMALFVGNANLRISTIGYENRAPSTFELDAMKNLLRDCMEEGALGLSSGLTYVPSMFSSIHELIELCRAMAPYGGIYNSHMRNEGDYLVESVIEVIEIAKQSGCRAHISHLKAMGERNWGKVEKCLELIEKANDDGIPTTFDVYPYTAGSTALKTLLPEWFLSRGFGDFSILKDQRDKIQKDLESSDWDNILLLCGSDRIFISAACGIKDYEGKNLAQIASEIGGSACDALCKILTETKGQGDMVYHSISEKDLQTLLKSKYCVLGTDAYARHLNGPTAIGRPHPRNYGGFPRYLRKYIFEKNLFSPEEGIWKISVLPSKIFGINDRGALAPGKYADITVFDPLKIGDTATWENPVQKPTGIDYVFVNGAPVVEFNGVKEARPGRVVSRVFRTFFS